MTVITTTIILGSFNNGVIVKKDPSLDLIIVDAARVSDWQAEIDRINNLGGIPGKLLIGGGTAKEFQLQNFKLNVDRSATVKDFNRFTVEADMVEEDNGTSVETQLRLAETTHIDMTFIGKIELKESGGRNYRYRHRDITEANIKISYPESKRPNRPVIGAPPHKAKEAVLEHIAVKDREVPKTQPLFISNQTKLFGRLFKLHDLKSTTALTPAEQEMYDSIVNHIRSDAALFDACRGVSALLDEVVTKPGVYTADGLRFMMVMERALRNESMELREVGKCKPRLSRVGFITVSFYDGTQPRVADFKVSLTGIEGLLKHRDCGPKWVGPTLRRRLVLVMSRAIEDAIAYRYGETLNGTVYIHSVSQGVRCRVMHILEELETFREIKKAV